MSEPKKKYYKVVKNDNGERKSARATTDMVVYKTDGWTYAPGNTRLFVFDNLSDAKSFRRLSNSEEIWECIISGGIKCKGSLSRYRINTFWSIFNKIVKSKKSTANIEEVVSKEVDLASFPAVLTKRVRLLKQID